MRFHRLRVTAFGPFAGAEEVDFEALNDAGVFLVTGATGAGKTSILDAICFALYGVVPGAREVRSLRSHHAAAGVRPDVLCRGSRRAPGRDLPRDGFRLREHDSLRKRAYQCPTCPRHGILGAGPGSASMIEGASILAASVPTIGHGRPETAAHG